MKINSKKSKPPVKKKYSRPLKQHTTALKENSYEQVKGKWYESDIPKDPEDYLQAKQDVVVKLRNEAEEALASEINKFKDRMSSNSDYNWMRTVMSKGTISDKVASYTISIQDAPLYSLSLLENLVNMVKLGKKKDCFSVIETLTELFIEDMMPKDWQKLRIFSHRPLTLLDSLAKGKQSVRKKMLVTWLFEDKLKQVYASFVSALCEVASKDSVERNRLQAIFALYRLLSNVAEKEDIILASLVNKFGDPNQKIPAKVMHHLKQLLQVHPAMKTVVMEEIEKLLFRLNISNKAQFYGLCFLSQFYLSEDDDELARSLIKLYFSFFKACVKKGEIDSRMMGALLTGVKRAYPYSKMRMEDESLMEHIQTVHKIVHLGNFNTSVHALSLLLQVMDCNNDVISDRFYTALYKKILDPLFATSNLKAMFLSVCFRALKNDTEVNRKKAFIKRFLEISYYMPPPLTCGILFMISEILYDIGDHQPLQFHCSKTISGNDGADIVELLDDDDEYEHYTDIKLEEDEVKVEKVEIKKGKQCKNVEIKKNEQSEKAGIKKEKDGCEFELANVKKEENSSKEATSWVHRSKLSLNERLKAKNLENGYDPNQRNPLYAVDSSCTYSELIRLSQHYHPTIALFAQKIANGESIDYSGDPLQDFALLRFLNRFAFKNPKKLKKAEDVEGKPVTFKKAYTPLGVKSLSVISASYLNEKEENIPVDEVFLYKYVKQRREEKFKNKQDEEEESDSESVKSDEFEEVMEKFIGKKKDADIDEEEDLNFADGVEFEDDGSGSDSEIKPKKKKVTKKKVKVDVYCFAVNVFQYLFNKRKLSDNESDSESDDEDIGDNDLSNVFASAEEFSEMLQETGASGLDTAGTSGLSNRDNAAVKQLNWEIARDKWVRGVDKYAKSRSFEKKSKIPKKKAKLRRK
ncbi:hypothetical protein J437_LFUL005088 [Ladona fulva]|uniref:CCAAT-binding factor domain-containing protein n=1 Tax=Ladona fulva TaxID=123851 RepID=A0A8K0JX68_LADFU|nr:hypothetical protein J437_LFUL005088 [Ladona fulva]